MATNKPYGDNARKGAVRKRSQLKTKVMGKKRWTKRDDETGEFKSQTKTKKKRKYAVDAQGLDLAPLPPAGQGLRVRK